MTNDGCQIGRQRDFHRIAAETYLELTDRPVRVGFGQPPNTAALAYAIRHLLKMQEIAAVAVYSITGTTSRVIAKNWIARPVLAFSSRPEQAITHPLKP